jgi:hypothetical protein
MTASVLETRIGSLLEVLDEDARHLESTLTRLKSLRALLLKREEAGLAKLLEEVRTQADTYRRNEQRRQQLRRELAADLGWAEGDLTLSRLQSKLAGPSRAALAQRQARLRSLGVELKREYSLTVLLVRDCIRFNRSLMQILLGCGGRGTATYSPTGATRHEFGTMLMSMQL